MGIETGDDTAVLLVLRGDAAGVISRNQHQPAADAGVVQVHQKIKDHVGPVMFHYCQRAGAAERGAHTYLKGHFLVDAPLGMDIRILGNILQHL